MEKPSSSERNIFKPTHLIAVALLVTGSFSEAAVVTWQPAATITGNADISTTGTLDRAYNLTDPSYRSDVSVNGVVFQPFAGTGTNSITVGNTTLASSSNMWADLGFGSVLAPFSNLDGSYQAIMGQEILGTAQVALTLNALTVGATYEFQIWSNQSNTASSRSLLVTAGNSVTLDSNTTNAVGGVGQFAIGTFTADATSQSFALTGAGGDDFQPMNAFQLRVIPEPGSVALLTVGAGALLLSNRRRRMRNPA